MLGYQCDRCKKFSVGNPQLRIYLGADLAHIRGGLDLCEGCTSLFKDFLGIKLSDLAIDSPDSEPSFVPPSQPATEAAPDALPILNDTFSPAALIQMRKTIEAVAGLAPQSPELSQLIDRGASIQRLYRWLAATIEGSPDADLTPRKSPTAVIAIAHLAAKSKEELKEFFR